MSESPIRVFVYGTLKKGFCNHRLLEGCTLLGEAESSFHGYQMFDNGAYPCLIEGSEKVKGEMYVVSQDVLRNLDMLEGHPELYLRKKRMFNIKGKSLEAWVYMYQQACKGMSYVVGCEYKKET